MLSNVTPLIYVRAIIRTQVFKYLSSILSTRPCYLNWVQLMHHFFSEDGSNRFMHKGKVVFIFFQYPKNRQSKRFSKFNKVEIRLVFLIKFCILYSFQAFKNVKAFELRKAQRKVQKEMMSLIWDKHCCFPTPELKYYASPDTFLFLLIVYFFK